MGGGEYTEESNKFEKGQWKCILRRERFANSNKPDILSQHLLCLQHSAFHQALNWKKALQTHVQPARDDEDSAETELEASSADRGCIYLIKNTVKL